MNNTLHTKRLFVALKELWLANRLLLYTFPLLILLCFAIYYLLPSGIFYNKWFHPEVYPTSAAWAKAILKTPTLGRAIILFLVPLYVVLCTKPTLDRLNKSEIFTLIPISRLERTIALTAFAIAVVILGFVSFVIFDHIIAAWFNKLYYDDMIRYLYKQGDLYPLISDEIAISAIPVKITFRLFMLVLLLPLYFLSMVYFKKNSFLVFGGFLTAIAMFLIFSLRSTVVHETSAISISIEGTLPSIVQILLILGYCILVMVSFYHKLKEKEI